MMLHVLSNDIINEREPLLEIDGLKTQFFTRKGIVPAVDGVTITVPKATVIGIVGESGCGKSMTAMSVMQLLQYPGRVVEGTIKLNGENLLDKTTEEMENIRGNKISMIFQEPMTSLNPVYTVGHQVEEAIQVHQHACTPNVDLTAEHSDSAWLVNENKIAEYVDYIIDYVEDHRGFSVASPANDRASDKQKHLKDVNRADDFEVVCRIVPDRLVSAHPHREMRSNK